MTLLNCRARAAGGNHERRPSIDLWYLSGEEQERARRETSCRRPRLSRPAAEGARGDGQGELFFT